MADEPAWWHVHSDPPGTCLGGATTWDLADDLAQVHEVKGTTVRLVASEISPDTCEYHQSGWVSLLGRVENSKPLFTIEGVSPTFDLDPEKYVAIGFDIKHSSSEAFRFFRGGKVILQGIVDHSDQIE